VAALRYPAERFVCFGMHVHVAVDGATKALQLIEAILPDLPMLLALSTSSPFLAGQETGLASTRLVLSQALPRTGLPPVFSTYAAYAASLERLQRAGAIADSTYLWWDVRLNARFGTIEVRIMDVQPRVRDSVAIAGLIQALVRHYGRRYDRGEGFRPADRFLIAENRWLAARHGLEAMLVEEDSSGPGQARDLVHLLLGRVSDDAAAVGASWALDRVDAILKEGSSAERQLSLLHAGLELREVVSALVDETEAL
jgi:carboxylate-amine ligase